MSVEQTEKYRSWGSARFWVEDIFVFSFEFVQGCPGPFDGNLIFSFFEACWILKSVV